eukprot:364398-Chlamydomonas_euryale.AAC.21
MPAADHHVHARLRACATASSRSSHFDLRRKCTGDGMDGGGGGHSSGSGYPKLFLKSSKSVPPMI